MGQISFAVSGIAAVMMTRVKNSDDAKQKISHVMSTPECGWENATDSLEPYAKFAEANTSLA